MRIAVLGGSFNPIHLGHIHIAKQAIKLLQVDKVMFVPVGLHHFKSVNDTPYDIRYEWTRKAIERYSDFMISDMGAPIYGVSYTKNLLIRLKEDNPKDEFIFIAGADILETLHKWHDYNWLLENVHFAFFTRPDAKPVDVNKLPKQISYFNIAPMPISSTEIRDCVASGQSIEKLVPRDITEDVKEFFLKF